MRKKVSGVLLAVFLVTVVLAVPAYAAVPGTVNLNINGDSITVAELGKDAGVRMISAKDVLRLSGADLTWKTQTEFSIVENGKCLTFHLDSTDVVVADKEGQKTIKLPYAPVKVGKEVYLPLRAVCRELGFVVGWQNNTQIVTLTREERRDGLTALEILTKSNEVARNIKTFSMEGTLAAEVGVTANGGGFAQKFSIGLDGCFQQQPYAYYIKETIIAKDNPEATQVIDIYMIEDKMYMKIGNQVWQELEFTNNMQEYLKKQQTIQSDSLKSIEQMKEMGMLVSLGNDIVLQGKDYYVLNCAVDTPKLLKECEKFMPGLLQGMPENEEQKEMIKKLLEKGNIGLDFAVLLNKETFLAEVIKYDMGMNFNIDMEDFMPEGSVANVPENILLDMSMKGDVKIVKINQPFVAPDVSQAEKIQ
jgi:hypothetical protein